MSDQNTGEEEGPEAGNAEASEATEEGSGRSWSSFSDIQDAVSEMVDSALRGVAPLAGARYPRYDIVHLPDSYWVLLDLPGVEKADLEITTVGDELTVSGTRHGPELPEGAELGRSERQTGRFQRTVPLASDVEVSGVTAKLESGVLRVTLPRRPKGSPHTVEVD